MMNASYSTIFEQTADQVWAIIRDFNSYPVWVSTVTDSHIEEGKTGDTVGAIRNFSESGTRIRQRLVALSDLDRSYVYESCGALGAVTWYRGTARILPIVDGNRAFLEWSITFECPAEEQANYSKELKQAMPRWFESLREVLAKSPKLK